METGIKQEYNLKLAISDYTICYDDLGTGEVPILFIHGFPFSKESWKPQMNFLSTIHRVIAIDLRGFGQSSSGKEKESMTLYANDLILFMDALHIEKAIVCGLSMGGYISLNAVNRFPERFAALILCDTQCIADSVEAKQKRAETIEKIATDGPNDFADDFIKRVFCNETLQTKKGLVQQVLSIIHATSTQTIMGGMQALSDRDETCQVLSKIEIPTLIICGSEDTITPPQQSEFLNREIKNATLQFIERAGHLSNLEQADEFNWHLENFIVTLYQQ